MPDNNAIVNWDDAYANRDHVPGAERLIENYSVLASRFRENAVRNNIKASYDLEYGAQARQKLDLFEPNSEARGLMVFVHGGYWLAFDKSHWSHLAKGALDRNWAVAIPSYTLCPDVSIGEITKQIGSAIDFAANRIIGDIVLAGHSAGGHLVSRMACEDAPIKNATAKRVKHHISISGVHDLRPLLNLTLNETLQLDEAQAEAESPALLKPRSGISIDCVAGSIERPEFIRQNALLANIWKGLGAASNEILVDEKHHFDIIEELHQPENGWLEAALD